MINFPENFFWGSGTSSHQVEGSNRNNWTEWEVSRGRIKKLEKLGLLKKFGLDNFISGKADDYYHRYREDLSTAKSMGHNAYRFSIEWSRIEPEEGRFDEESIGYYKDVVKTLRGLGMEPFVTLWHWSLPVWFAKKGGFENPESPVLLARFADKIASSLKEVKFWVTMNEPQNYAVEAYLVGLRPPQKKNLLAYLRVIDNMVESHKSAFSAIKKIIPAAQVGIASNNMHFEGYRGRRVNKAIAGLGDRWWNHWFLGRVNSSLDFIGLNHYIHLVVNYGFFSYKGFGKKDIAVSDLGWELNPESIHRVLSDLKRYGKPVYITENGLADKEDKHRQWFIRETLKCVSKAIDEGVDVRGYFHWSLLDNFEWTDGFWPRFGLLEVDYKTLERKIRPSAVFYKEVCLKNGLPE